jgi:hypothetical protein
MVVATSISAQEAGTAVAHVAASLEPLPTARLVRVVVSPTIYDMLGTLADTLRVETVRCLIGVRRADSLIIDLAWQPEIQAASESRVRYRPCPVATVALWHNHIPMSDLSPEDMCYMSPTDINEAMRPHAPYLQVVQVNHEVICWWTRAQVVRAEDFPILPALPGQRLGFLAEQARPCVPGVPMAVNGCPDMTAGPPNGGPPK